MTWSVIISYIRHKTNWPTRRIRAWTGYTAGRFAGSSGPGMGGWSGGCHRRSTGAGARVAAPGVFLFPGVFTMNKKPVRVAVTGAAGQIGYALLFRIASGEMLGKDQPVILQLLELPLEKAQAALKGVIMELEDCAFPLLAGVVGTDDPEVAFKDVDVALLVGARPRGPGMERKDLLEANGAIFVPQGKALGEVASRDVKVLVVGNPANTNALIAMKNAKGLKPSQFTAMMRL